MKVSSIVCYVATFSTVFAIRGRRAGVQEVLSPQEQMLDFDYSKSYNMFTQLKSQLGNVEGSENYEIISAWKEMSSWMDEHDIESLIEKIENKLKGKTSSSKEQVEATLANNDCFEEISIKQYPGHSLRIKRNSPEILGLDTVDQYTGYLDVKEEDKHFFYWFFESRNDPENDPVILWLNGGPGCSSATGLFFELGPSLINATLEPVYNPYSWNSNASVIFLDQPVNVGYSYSSKSQIGSTDAAAKDFFVFLELFFQKFPRFLKNKFHIAGESYAGHYIPKFASEIINHADRSFELASVLIGNGITDALIQSKYYKPMACGEGGYKQVLNDSTCEQMEKDHPRCAALIKLCYATPNVFTCVPPEVYCNARLLDPYVKTGLNVYDIRKPCSGELCYDSMKYLQQYLNLDFVRNAVGASSQVKNFTGCDESVSLNFLFTGDGSKPFQQYVAELLEKKVPVLIYAGDKDFICNWLGNHAWTESLPYEKQQEFQQQPLRQWLTKEEKVAGEVKNFDIFTFLRIFDAGHMVPYDQPKNSLDMVNRWINGDYSFSQ